VLNPTAFQLLETYNTSTSKALIRACPIAGSTILYRIVHVGKQSVRKSVF
jgi:hypothetical protein